MKTVLYDIQQDKVISKEFDGGYYVDGKKPQLPTNIIELTVLNNTIPSYDSETQKLTGGNWVADLINYTYHKDWEVVDLTPYEIALKEWKHPEYAQKLHVHGSVLFTSTGTAYRSYIQDRGYPFEITPENDYLIWINDVLPDHEAYINSLVQNELCVITQRPQEF